MRPHQVLKESVLGLRGIQPQGVPVGWQLEQVEAAQQVETVSGRLFGLCGTSAP